MRIFRYKREKTLSTHNFGSHQIYVCELSDTSGVVFKGITVLNSNTVAEVPYPMEMQEAKEFISFLDKLVHKDVPCEFTIKCGLKNYFINLYFVALSYKDENIKVKILAGNLFGINWLTDDIKISSISSCLSSLKALYRMPNN